MPTLEERIEIAERKEKELQELKRKLKARVREKEAKEAKREAKRYQKECIEAGKLYLEVVKPWMQNTTHSYTKANGERAQRSILRWFESENPEPSNEQTETSDERIDTNADEYLNAGTVENSA